MKRLFAAIKIEPEPEIRPLLDSLKRKFAMEKIRWVSPDNIHVTLKFFGDTEEDQIPFLSETFRKIAGESGPFSISFEKLSFFGSRNNPKVLWLSLKENEELTKLIDKVNIEFKTPGYNADKDDIHSHLTLGRLKILNDQRNFLEVIKSEISTGKTYAIDHFTIYQSVLTHTGPIYTGLENYFFEKKS